MISRPVCRAASEDAENRRGPPSQRRWRPREVLAATIEAVMARDLVNAEVMDPDLPFQSMTPRRALSALTRETSVSSSSAPATAPSGS